MKKLFAGLKETLKSNRPIVLGIKFIPVISVMLLTLHVGLLLCGWHEVITVGLSAVLLVTLLILLSIRFNFCMLHKALIAYMAVMTLCICIQRMDGFGQALTIFRTIMFMLGLILSYLAVKKFNDDDCGK